MNILSLALILVGLQRFRCDLIAKSSITICENTGSSDDPMSVVYEKACEKKLIVTMSVRSGQNGTEMLKTVSNVSKVYDEEEKEHARLYNPFIISLQKTPVNLVYPYFYRGVVNNKPEEKVVVSDNALHSSESRDLCSDMWSDKEATCGFAYDHDGNAIWDSQGFCCWCSEQDKWRGSFDKHTPFSRAGLSCKLFTKAQAAAHCMKYGDLWYTVNEIGRWQMEFGIHVKTYDQVTQKEGNLTKAKWVPGGEIVIGPSVRRGRGKYGRLLASFIGEFQSHKQFPTLTEKYLFIPYITDKIDPKTHPQVRRGVVDFMIIDKHEVNYKPSGPHECDKIGVTYTAFRNQQPAGCKQKKGACLNNQPKDYFEEDTKRRNEGRTPYYFPERFGKLVGIKKRPHNDREKYMLAFEVDEVMTSLVTLQISADDIILIYNRASGKILKAYAQDFEALSKDGHLFVVVQNTGYVTADFYVVISECSGAIGKFHEKSHSINPQKTQVFQFGIHAYGLKGGNQYCVVQLFDARQKMIDSANVTFTTTAPCVCATGCGCSCYDTGFECVDRDEKDWTEEKPKDTGLDLSGATTFWEKVKNFFKKIGKVLKFLTTGGGIASILGILVGLGAIKACLGLRRKGAAVARFGMGGVKKGRKEKKDKTGHVVVVEYNEYGDQIDPDTKNVTKPRNKRKEFFFNLFFFIVWPFLLMYHFCKRIFKKSKTSQREPETQKRKEDEGDYKERGEEESIMSGKGENPFAVGTQSSCELSQSIADIKCSNKHSEELLLNQHGVDSSVGTVESGQIDGDDEKVMVVEESGDGQQKLVESRHSDEESEVIADTEHCDRKESFDDPGSKVPDDIRPLVEPNSLVYHKYFSSDAVAAALENPGEQFCLAGKLTCLPGPSSIQYRFDLLMALQICSNVDGRQQVLNRPATLDPHLFSKLMSVQEIRDRISMTPQGPCLNLK